MSNNRGIFENLSDKPSSSPFSVVHEPAAAAPSSSPFTAVQPGSSPFAAVDPAPKSSKLPERRKPESPFQVPDASEGFGFEAAPSSSPFAAAPFEAAPSASPFAAAPMETSRPAAASPFSTEPASSVPSWPPQATPAPVQFTPVATPAPAPAPAQRPPVQPTPATTPVSRGAEESDSFSIRQLELRAIFGVDREMSSDEIMQRARSLPGIRHIARVSQQDIGAVDAIKQVIANLGFGGGGIKLYAGSVPVEFIREGSVLLAVQTDGGFAPGIRETLMIVARELGRTA
jgi:hypothetical protein